MSLFKIKTAPLLLIEDYQSINTLPLLLETTQQKNSMLNIFCYEQPVSSWNNAFREHPKVAYHEEFVPSMYEQYTNCNTKISVLIDSVNQMALCLGWNECLKIIKKLLQDCKILQIVLLLHKDCLSHLSKLQIHLNHIASAIVSYDTKNANKIRIQLKKNGKIFKSEELLSYDTVFKCLKSSQIKKEEKKEEEAEKPLPENLTTFKIEVDQTDKLEKYKLKLPYMNKINEGESKVYYEPDAVDDWDEEDPDEDLDI